MKLNLGPGEHYAPGWNNLDVAAAVAAGVTCDTIVDSARPFAGFDDSTADQILLSHVLEHVWWPDVPAIVAEAYRVLCPGGRVLTAGPDVYRTLEWWKRGQAGWDLVCSVLEHADRADDEWPEAVHKWNCHEARLVALLTAAGFVDVTPTDDFSDWPVVNWTTWQCAVVARKPG